MTQRRSVEGANVPSGRTRSDYFKILRGLHLDPHTAKIVDRAEREYREIERARAASTRPKRSE